MLDPDPGKYGLEEIGSSILARSFFYFKIEKIRLSLLAYALGWRGKMLDLDLREVSCRILQYVKWDQLDFDRLMNTMEWLYDSTLK